MKRREAERLDAAAYVRGSCHWLYNCTSDSQVPVLAVGESGDIDDAVFYDPVTGRAFTVQENGNVDRLSTVNETLDQYDPEEL